MPFLNLPGVEVHVHSVRREETGWSHRFVLLVPDGLEFLSLVVAKENKLEKVWVDGQLALDSSLETKHRRKADSLRLVNPDKSSFEIRLQTGSPKAISLSAVTWHPLPKELVTPYMSNWPEDAQETQFRSRARKIQRIELEAHFTE